ncbi:MAG TPA: glycosyltransferase family 39 protein [Terriglobales bacterium]|nr:glycosyltransferase family 39 protein [Terriglobales bacterium]
MPGGADDTPKAPSSHRALTDWLLLAGFCAFLFFFGLGYFGLIGADEPRYAQVAREMLARRDWITPTLGGKPWLEKPALYYWQAMLAFRWFGVSDWAARLPSALDATLMVVAVYLFLRRFRPGCQLDGALMTASAAGVIGFARAASMDMPLAAAFTIALLAWYAWYESRSKSYLILFYLFTALGMLAKGPVAPLLVAFVIALFAVAKGEYRLVWQTSWIPGVAVFCAVALPWYIAVQIRNPEFFRVFILEHNLERFGINLYHHKAPFWYYLPVVLLGLVPWVVFILAALAECLRAWWVEKREFLQSEDALTAFLVVWLVVPILFFSLSESKLPGYVVPVLPAGTLLLSEYVRRRLGSVERPSLLLAVLHSLIAALPLVPALMLQYILLQHRLPWGTAAAISTGLTLVVAAAMAATLRTQQGLGMLRFVTLVPVVLAVTAVLRIGAPKLDETLSARPLAKEISRVEAQTLPLAVFRVSRETEFGLEFYRDRAITRYEWGPAPATEHLVVTPEGFQARLAKKLGGRRFSYLGGFAPQHVEYYWVAGKSSN